MKSRFALLIAFLFLGVLSCRLILRPIENTPTPKPVPGINELGFEDPATEARFKSLNQCINNLTDESWKTTSYQYIGNFYESRWCTGDGARDDCQITLPSQDERNQHVIGLYTLHYPNAPTDMFGLGLQTLWVPDSTGWSASFFLSEKGKTIIGEGWVLYFRHYTTTSGPPEASVTLGNDYTYNIGQTNIDISTTAPLRKDLAIYLESPESMRDRGVEQLRTLQDKVITSLEAHEITACNYGEYQGSGIPPICTPRPMTLEQETTEIKRAREYFDGQIQLLNENYKEMHAAWMLSFPMDSCWK